MRATVILMLKEPVPGSVKTRLAADLGKETACQIYRRLVERQLRQIPAGMQVEVCFSPSEAGPVMRSWLGTGVGYEAQVEGDLGARMSAAVERRRPSGGQPVILLGGDCPYADAIILRQSLDLLQWHEVVLGPSLDGGYYLLGMTRFVPELFCEMRWSTETVFAETLRRLDVLGIVPGLLPILEDVDDLSGWTRAQKQLPECFDL